MHGNYLKPSIRNAGLDPDNLPESDPSKMNFGGGEGAKKAWKDIWGCGQGIGAVKAVVPAAALVARLAREYGRRQGRLAAEQEPCMNRSTMMSFSLVDGSSGLRLGRHRCRHRCADRPRRCRVASVDHAVADVVQPSSQRHRRLAPQ